MSERDKARKYNRRKKMRYFFNDGMLYKVLYTNRPKDLMYAWSYPDRKRVAFVFSHIKRSHERAFTTLEVSDMVSRGRDVIEDYIRLGHIRKPAMTYTLDGNFKPVKYMWREKDILELHDYMMTIHFGRPRNDGEVTPYPCPTKAELRAMMAHDVVYYVENDKGEKVKVFKEPIW